LPATTGASRPFWSPDGRALGFFSDGRLRTIDVGTNTVQTLATVGPFPVGGSWSSRGIIIFADRRSNLFAVSAQGGAPRPVTTLNRGAQESAHRFPFFLPDGDHFLYYANSVNPQHAGTYISSLSGAPPRRLLDASSEGTVFAAPGYLLHVSERRLVAQALDPAMQTVSNPAAVLANDVAAPQLTNAVTISAAPSGLLAFGGGAADTRLTWFDRTGKTLSTVVAIPQLHNPSLTDDDRAIVAGSGNPERRGTWLIDADAGTPTRSVPDATVGAASPDGTQLAFSANRIGGVANIYALTFGAAADTLLLQTEHPKAVSDWSTDGRYIVFTNSDPQSKEDIWLLPTIGNRQPIPFLRTPFNEMQGEVSPDGRWLAYASDESGRWEVYVQAFPDGGWKRAISTSGGYEPHWRRDGRELFYLSTDQHVIAVDMTPGAALHAGRPHALFQVTLSADLPTIYRNQFAVTGDGRRFLIDSLQGQSEPITVLLDWPRLLTASATAQR
jgi:Tol biopolymer transport system component